MEQQIHFCTASDGVRIAYAVAGEGSPLIRVSGWLSHIEYEWKGRYWRPFIEVMASRFRYIRYDIRGVGLSDRQVHDFSLDAHVRDLEAVADAAGLERFGLFALSAGGATAIAYAVRHPERVTHLNLYGSFARHLPVGLSTEEARAQLEAMLTLVRHGWDTDNPAFRQMFTGLFIPDADGDSIREFNEMQRIATTAEIAVPLFAALAKIDVTDLLANVSVPTLVLHRMGDAAVPFETGRQLATAIPGARFFPVEGNNHIFLPHEPELQTVVGEIENFTREVLGGEKMAGQSGGKDSQSRGTGERSLVGERISHYRILEKIGEGGMGVVYKAEDTSLQRAVALKFLPADLTRDFEMRERFLREARAAAALDHPSICAVHEIGDFEGKTFIAMAHIDGQGLNERLESGPLEVNEAIDLAIQIAEGLQEAHEKGIIHRDIKAANIMLTKRGHARIMDFGLAKLAGKTRLTKTATVMGTVDYMSPEQAHGETAIDHRTDIWSLGVLMYEMLGGRLPFDAPSDAGVIHKIVYEEPKPLGSIRADVPVAFEQAIKKTLQKEPSQRYEEMASLIEDLHTIRKDPVAALVSEELAGPLIGRRTPFVGRENEKAELSGFLTRAKSGNGALAMLGGEPGVGKTRMTEELEAEANRHGFLTLTGHCYEMEGAPPYIPFIEILQSIMRTTEPDILRETLGDSAPEAAKLVPELRQQYPDIPEPRKLPPEQERLFLFNSLRDFLERLATGRPLLIVIEDLHWADESTLLLLQHIAQRLHEMSILLVGTYRDTELDVARSLAKALEELLRQRLAHDLLLKRFDEDGVTAMLRGRSGQEPPSRLVNLIFDETEGNPFFIEEVFNHLAEEEKLFDTEGKWRGDVQIEEWEVPRGVLLVIGRRLERVSDECRRILARAAVIGRGIGFNLLNEVIELDEDVLFDAIEEAERAQLIRSKKPNGEVQLTFAHELIRQTLLNDLSLARRQRFHQRVAEAMEQLYAGVLEHHAGDLAYHFHQAGGDAEKIITYSVMAAERATAQTAYEEAVIQYEQALGIFEQQGPVNELRHCDLLLSLGNAYTNAGNLQQAEEFYFKTMDIARNVPAPNHFAEALTAVHTQRGVVGAPDERIVSLTEEGLAVLPEKDSALRAILLARLSIELVNIQGSAERSLALGEDALAMARRVNDPFALLVVIISRTFSSNLSARKAIAELTEALELAKRGVGKPEFGGWVLVFRHNNYMKLGDIASADKDLAELKERNAELSLPTNVFHTANIQAMRAFLAGRFDETESLAFEALSHGQKANQGNAMQYFGGVMSTLRWYQGRMAEIEDMFLAEAEKYPDAPIFQIMLAIIHREMGREESAREIFERLAANEFTDLPQDITTDGLFRDLSELACAFGDKHRAALLYDLLLPHSERLLMVGINCICTGSTRLWLGMLATTLERWDDAVKHFEAAIKTNARIGARPFVARSQHEYARMLIERNESGDKEKAKSLLTDATSAYRDIGMPKFLEDAEELLSKL